MELGYIVIASSEIIHNIIVYRVSDYYTTIIPKMEVYMCTCMHIYSINYGTSMLEYRFFGLAYVLLCFCPGNGYRNVFYT